MGPQNALKKASGVYTPIILLYSPKPPPNPPKTCPKPAQDLPKPAPNLPESAPKPGVYRENYSDSKPL